MHCASATQSSPSGLMFLYDVADKWCSFALQAYSGSFPDHHSAGFLLCVLCLSGGQPETGWTYTSFISWGEVRGCEGAWVALSSCVLWLFSTKGLVSVGYAAQKSPLLCPVTLEDWFSCSSRAGFPENLCDFAEVLEVSVGPFLVREQQERDESRGTVPFLSCPPQLIGLLVSMAMCQSQDLL